MRGYPTSIQRKGQPEVTNARLPIAGEPDVARFQVSVNDAVRVCIGEPVCNRKPNFNCFIDWKPSVGCTSQRVLDAAASHQGKDHENLTRIFTDVINRHYIGMLAQLTHSLGFAHYPVATYIVKSL